MPNATSEPRGALYLDSSALAKLVIDEPESTALRHHIEARDVVSSALALAEVPRAAGRRRTAIGAGALAGLFEGIALVPVDDGILMVAGAYAEPGLRTLDAIHLASAQAAMDEIDAFVGYDHRQLEAAARAGLRIASPA